MNESYVVIGVVALVGILGSFMVINGGINADVIKVNGVTQPTVGVLGGGVQTTSANVYTQAEIDAKLSSLQASMANKDDLANLGRTVQITEGQSANVYFDYLNETHMIKVLSISGNSANLTIDGASATTIQGNALSKGDSYFIMTTTNCDMADNCYNANPPMFKLVNVFYTKKPGTKSYVILYIYPGELMAGKLASATWQSANAYACIDFQGKIFRSQTPCPQSCTDSDNGANFFVKGTTSGLNSRGEGSTATDYCVYAGQQGTYGQYLQPGQTAVMEYVCGNNGSMNDNLHVCDKGCQDGACIS